MMKKIRAKIVFDTIINVEEENWNHADWVAAWEDDIYFAIDNFPNGAEITFEEIE